MELVGTIFLSQEKNVMTPIQTKTMDAQARVQKKMDSFASSLHKYALLTVRMGSSEETKNVMI